MLWRLTVKSGIPLGETQKFKDFVYLIYEVETRLRRVYLTMQYVNCETSLEINTDWHQRHNEVRAEDGTFCKFDLINLQERWTLNEPFTCGTSSTRVVMCKKGFEVMKKV